MTKNKNKKSSEAAKQEAFKLSDGICYCKTPEGNLTALKNSQYEAYQNLRKYEKELHTVQTNIDTFLGKDRSQQSELEKETTRS